MTQGETLILRLLHTKNYYGYELEKVIDQYHMRHWTELGFSSIYNILNKLAKKELIAYRYEKEYGAPRRKVYYILDKGREAVTEEIKRMLTSPKKVYPDFSVGLILSDLLTDDEFQETLRGYKQYLLKKRALYEQAVPESFRKRKRTVALAYERIMALLEAELSWIDTQLTLG
jgi:DNA-binding PadR family transcriptional regulator